MNVCSVFAALKFYDNNL